MDGGRTDWSLPHRPRSRLDQLGQASPIGPVPWELTELPESAEFARVGPDHVVPVLVPTHVHPADPDPAPDGVRVDRESLTVTVTVTVPDRAVPGPA